MVPSRFTETRIRSRSRPTRPSVGGQRPQVIRESRYRYFVREWDEFPKAGNFPQVVYLQKTNDTLVYIRNTLRTGC